MVKQVYMVVDADDTFELPVLVSDKVIDVARFLGITLHSAYTMISRNALMNRRYRVEKVRLSGADLDDGD